ncbi:hydantoinase/oxoprolinase family protein [Octadecabacter sp.]|nr:hydantoinase/oxoprolinase family protein [Octadecabacter sp.]
MEWGSDLRIGIDVGGTHTDAVLLDGDTVRASHKALTSSDVIQGIIDALDALTEQGTVAEQIDAVMIGTTQFTNAVIERRELSQVAAVRLSLPAGRGLPPKVGWPDDIAEKLGDHAYELHGGYLYNGRALSSLVDGEVDALIADLKKTGVRAIAITSAFSPMNAKPEQDLANRITRELPDARITMSHQIGRVGLLERENAALLNAALLGFADRVVDAFHGAIARFGITCPIFISQNDGTLMDVEFVRAYPALTFASGPTNSLRGAAQLTGLKDAIVIDIGGTTSDIGILRGGFPRESNMVVEVGGVRTNFRMPDLLAIGLGGGSIVSEDGLQVGPQSVGHRLVTEGLVFGGKTLTTTDIIVAAGRAEIGDVAAVKHLSADTVSNGINKIKSILETGVRKMKPSADPLPIILVGGGAVLAPLTLAGGGEVLCPAHSGVANAIGAAIAQIGGEAERFVNYAEAGRDKAIADVTQDARSIALKAGADPATIRVNDIEEIAIPYMDAGAMRVRVKVVGDVAALSGRTEGASL